MSGLRPRGIPIIFDGVERHFLFTLNLVDEIQEKYGKNLLQVLDQMVKEDQSEHTLRDITVMLLNDEAERAERRGQEIPKVTEADVGEMIGLDNYWDVVKAILEAYGISLPEPEEEDPNRVSGQQSS